MRKRPAGVVVIALWCAIGPAICVGELAWAAHMGPSYWMSVPSYQEIMGPRSTSLQLQAEREAAQESAMWNPGYAAIYYFWPLFLAKTDMVPVLYFFASIVSCIGLWSLRNWGRIYATLLFSGTACLVVVRILKGPPGGLSHFWMIPYAATAGLCMWGIPYLFRPAVRSTFR